MSTKSVGPNLIFLISTRQTDRMADKSLGDSRVSPALCGQRGRTRPLMPRGRTNISKNLSGDPILALKIIHQLPSEIKRLNNKKYLAVWGCLLLFGEAVQ